MNDIGKVLFPEQYAPAGKEIAVKNSAAALKLFERSYPKGGIVLLGHLKLASVQKPYLPVWMYFMPDEKCPELLGTLPLYRLDAPDKIEQLPLLAVEPYEDEIFFVYKKTLYSSVYTTKGEIAIMKVRSLLCSGEATLGISVLHNKEISDIYPVDLYSHSKHKFVGICWNVVFEDEDTTDYWYPVSFDEEKRIGSYDLDDLKAHPVNIGEDAVIGGITYKLFYSDELGYYFKKKPAPSPERIKLITDVLRKRAEALAQRPS